MARSSLATPGELLETVFSMRSVIRDYILRTPAEQYGVVRESVKRRQVSRCSCEPAGNQVSAEAEQSPLLEAGEDM
jgi:hypothetical protein